MPRFSAFWLTHYKEIGNCCMTAPLKKLKVRSNEKVKMPDKFQSLQLVEDYIDTGWMDQKQLKWIGWDIQGWYAWTDPNGMLYRIKDLQRNEDGREYEKEVEEIVASGDPRTHQGNPTAKELYTFERDMQRNCGFCPDGSGGGSDADHEGDKGSDTKKENIADDIDLDKLMQGDITDFMPGDEGVTYVPEMREYAPIIDTTEITETGHITADIFGTFGGDAYTPGIDEYGAGNVDDGGGEIVKEIIDYLPVLPPKPMPTPQQQHIQTHIAPDWRQNPVTRTGHVTARAGITETARGLNVPYKDRKLQYIDEPEEHFDFYDPDPQEKGTSKSKQQSELPEQKGNIGKYTEKELNDAIKTVYGELTTPPHKDTQKEAEAIASTIFGRKKDIEEARRKYEDADKRAKQAKNAWNEAVRRHDDMKGNGAEKKSAFEEYMQRTKERNLAENARTEARTKLGEVENGTISNDKRGKPITLTDIVSIHQQYAGTRKGQSDYEKFDTFNDKAKKDHMIRYEAAKAAVVKLANSIMNIGSYRSFKGGNLRPNGARPGETKIGGNYFKNTLL